MGEHIIILLGGNNLKNRDWINEISRYLKVNYITVDFFYDHWEKNLQDIDFEIEIQRLSQFIKDRNITNYSIVAKSAGFLLWLQWVSNGVLKPRTIVWFGLPLEYSKYRNIDPKFLINIASRKTNILCVQASEDPQWNLKCIKKLTSEMIPVYGIKSHTHSYNDFKENSNIAIAFIGIHQPQIEHKIEKIEAESILDVIKFVNQFPEKYFFKNNWIFDIKKKIYIFSHNNKIIILKKWNIRKLKKEIEIASRAKQLISGIKTKSRELIVVVPNLCKVNKQIGYIFSEYIGPDCNELFYQHENINFCKEDLLNIIRELNNHSILYKGLLPRNMIIRNDKVYLIDWESTVINENIENIFLQYKASLLVGWKYFNEITELDIEWIFSHTIKVEQSISYLNKYEDTYKNMLGLVDLGNNNIQKLCYENIINLTNYEKWFSLLKLDDILHFLSEVLPIEIEVLIDFILSKECEQWFFDLYVKLSNIIKIARMKSFMGISSKQLKYFINEQIRNLIIDKLTNEHSELWINQAIIKFIQKRNSWKNPSDNYLNLIKEFLFI